MKQTSSKLHSFFRSFMLHNPLNCTEFNGKEISIGTRWRRKGTELISSNIYTLWRIFYRPCNCQASWLLILTFTFATK